MKKKLRKEKLGALGLKPIGRLTRFEMLLEQAAEKYVAGLFRRRKPEPRPKTKAELKGKRRKERWTPDDKWDQKMIQLRNFNEFCRRGR